MGEPSDSSIPKPSSTTAEYLIELGKRVREHSKRSVIGGQATREVDYAGMILVKIGEDWLEKKNNVAT